MSLLVLLVGAFIGWLVAAFTRREEGMFTSAFIGMVGAVIGAIVSVLVFGGGHNIFALQWHDIFWGAVGALVLTIIVNAARRPDGARSK